MQSFTVFSCFFVSSTQDCNRQSRSLHPHRTNRRGLLPDSGSPIYHSQPTCHVPPSVAGYRPIRRPVVRPARSSAHCLTSLRVIGMLSPYIHHQHIFWHPLDCIAFLLGVVFVLAPKPPPCYSFQVPKRQRSWVLRHQFICG